jgi:phytoene dehydrogenase-like protein
MPLKQLVVLALLPMFLVSTQALAQQARVVDGTTMSQALASQAATEDAQRELVRRVLDRDDARALAAQMGLSAERANAAVGTLSSAELATLAQHAAGVEAAALAGGNTIVISTVSLLLILIIVILLVK